MKITDRGHGAAYSLIEGFYQTGIQKMNKRNYVGAALDFRIVDIVYETADFSMPSSPEFEAQIKDAALNLEECSKLIPEKVDFTLSKSTFTYGMQCQKRLFLNKNHPQERTPPDVITQKKFDAGHDFEKSFKDRFKHAVDVKKQLGKNFKQYPRYTFDVLKGSNFEYPYFAENKVIFEAGFCYDDVLVLVDVLERDNNENYKIYEVKNYSEIKEVTWWDLSIQYYVLSHILPCIEEFNVVLRGEDGDFNVINVLAELRERLPDIEEKVGSFKQILKRSDIPDISMGAHCMNPYKCDFMEFCKKSQTNGQGNFSRKRYSIGSLFRKLLTFR